MLTTIRRRPPPIITAVPTPRTVPVTPPSPSDMDRMFDGMRKDIDARRAAVANLEKLVETARANPAQFDDEDNAVNERVLAQRREDLARAEHEFSLGQTLYRENIMDLEARIARKVHLLQELDRELGVLSGDETLRQHYLQNLVTLRKALQAAKDQLRTAFCERYFTSCAVRKQ
jgi:hypothetical protein